MSKFVWGRVIAEHTIGPYTIIEYAERGADNHDTHPRRETGRTLFHVPYRPGGNNGESFTTLDRALLGAIGLRTGDYRVADYAAQLMGLPTTEPPSQERGSSSTD